MSYFSDASLVYIPAAIKNGKTYSIKPTDGTGDLTFTRASSATRVGPNGYIEKVRTNYLINSNTFTGWSLEGGTITGGFSDPDGGLTAYKYVQTTGGLYSNVAATDSLPKITSIYLKSVDGTSYNVNLGNGDAGNITIATITPTWQRFTNADTAASTRLALYIYNIGNVGGVMVWHPQAEYGDVATDYIPTTTAVVSVGPVSGTPRLDYLGSDCGRLLLEPSRTNIAPYSEAFSNYSLQNVTITSNATTSPDGYANADKLIPTTTSGFHSVDYVPSVIVTTYTLSVFAKAGEYSKIALLTNNRGTNMARGFDLINGTTFANDFGYTEPTAYAITNYGNGWYRCSITFPKTSTGTSGNGIAVVNDAGATTFAGNGTDGVFIYGFQMEPDAAYPSSLIPTLGTSVTRVADEAVKTGISSLIGQSEGTMFVEVDLNHTSIGNTYILQVFQDSSNRILLYRSFGDVVGCYILKGAGSVYDTTSASSYSGRTKIAFAYKSGDIAFYVNGTQIGTSSATYTAFASLADLNIDSNAGLERGYYNYNQAILFKTRLTNAQLAELTTL